MPTRSPSPAALPPGDPHRHCDLVGAQKPLEPRNARLPLAQTASVVVRSSLTIWFAMALTSIRRSRSRSAAPAAGLALRAYWQSSSGRPTSAARNLSRETRYQVPSPARTQ